MNRSIFSTTAAMLCAVLAVEPALAQSTINTALPASNANLSSLVVRQQFQAAASDINGLLSKHASTSTTQCPATPFPGEECLTIGAQPYIDYVWTAGTAGWAPFFSINPSTGVVALAMNSGEIAGTNPIGVTFPGGVATVALNYDGNFTNNGSNQLAFNPIASGDILANCTGATAEPTLSTWSTCMDRNIGSTNGMLPLRAGGAWGNVALGTSVGQPGTGTLETLLPVQTAAGASKVFATADLFKKTRRSNAGTAMTDTFPASTATGLVNGTRIVIANVDASASITITAGSGTVMSQGTSTDTVGPGRDVAYEYDLASTQWRRAYNTGTAVLGPNNGSDFSSIPTVRSNLGLAALYTVNGVAHQWINSVVAGVPTLTQPAIADISGWGTNVAAALGNPLNGASGLVGFSGNVGAAAGTSLALNGCTIGGNTLCLTGPFAFSAGGSFGGALSGISTLSMSGQLTSTLSTGTAPFSVASTTNVPNLNASSLNGATFASPGAIGGTTPGSIAATTLSASGAVSGAGFSAYLASPPAIGGTAAAAGSFTTLNATTYNGGALSGTFSGTPTLSGANFITLANLVQSTAGAQFLGVTGASAGNYAPFTLASLTALTSPNATLDLVPCVDHTSGTIKSCTPSSIAAAAGSGVASINGAAGALTLTKGLSNSGTVLSQQNHGSNILEANGAQEIWQIGTSVAVAASATVYVGPDRWYGVTGATQASVVSRQAGIVSGSRYAAKFLRNSGQTGTGVMRFAYPLITDEATRAQGQLLALSFTAKAGANWSPASGTLTYNVFLGTGAAAKQTVGFTSQTNPITGTVNLTTTATQTIAIASAAAGSAVTQGEVTFTWTPTGTAGADDSFTIDDVRLDVIPSGTTSFVPPIEHLDHSVYFFDCRQVYRQSYVEGTAPATATNTNRIQYVSPFSGVGESLPPYAYSPSMWTTPAVTPFSPSSGAGGAIFDATGATDIGGTFETISTDGHAGFSVGQTGDHVIFYHYTADARL